MERRKVNFEWEKGEGESVSRKETKERVGI